MSEPILDKGRVAFSIESRVLRELGERLVKQPEVALLELVKNAYDADATRCVVKYDWPHRIVITDDGSGMTLDRFRDAWMRIGTSFKESTRSTIRYGRRITGEKGIGRFAVRFLGGSLGLQSIAYDKARQVLTRLAVDFEWDRFDQTEDLGKVEIQYVLTTVEPGTETGTVLTVGKLRPQAEVIDWKKVRTGSATIVTAVPLSSPQVNIAPSGTPQPDPGFRLTVATGKEEPEDLTSAMLSHYVLRATLSVVGSRLRLEVFKQDSDDCYLLVEDEYPNGIAPVDADIRFFPRRTGTFVNAAIDGRAAYSWLKENGGIRVFDNGFMVQPYGMGGDDWLKARFESHEAGSRLRFGWTARCSMRRIMARVTMASDTSGRCS